MLRLRYLILFRFRVHLALILLLSGACVFLLESVASGLGPLAIGILAALGLLELRRLTHLPRRVMAVHEAAHAVVAWHTAHHGRPTVAVIGPMMGYVDYDELGSNASMDEVLRAPLPVLQARTIGFLAGIAAELHLGRSPVMGGAPDLLKSILCARAYAMRSRAHSEAFLEECYAASREAVARHWTSIERLADALEQDGSLDADAIAAILGPRPSPN
jgi:ATP-dependent Zn protease